MTKRVELKTNLLLEGLIGLEALATRLDRRHSLEDLEHRVTDLEGAQSQLEARMVQVVGSQQAIEQEENAEGSDSLLISVWSTQLNTGRHSSVQVVSKTPLEGSQWKNEEEESSEKSVLDLHAIMPVKSSIETHTDTNVVADKGVVMSRTLESLSSSFVNRISPLESIDFESFVRKEISKDTIVGQGKRDAFRNLDRRSSGVKQFECKMEEEPFKGLRFILNKGGRQMMDPYGKIEVESLVSGESTLMQMPSFPATPANSSVGSVITEIYSPMNITVYQSSDEVQSILSDKVLIKEKNGDGLGGKDQNGFDEEKGVTYFYIQTMSQIMHPCNIQIRNSSGHILRVDSMGDSNENVNSDVSYNVQTLFQTMSLDNDKIKDSSDHILEKGSASDLGESEEFVTSSNFQTMVPDDIANTNPNILGNVSQSELIKDEIGSVWYLPIAGQSTSTIDEDSVTNITSRYMNVGSPLMSASSDNLSVDEVFTMSGTRVMGDEELSKLSARLKNLRNEILKAGKPQDEQGESHSCIPTSIHSALNEEQTNDALFDDALRFIDSETLISASTCHAPQLNMPSTSRDSEKFSAINKAVDESREMEILMHELKSHFVPEKEGFRQTELDVYLTQMDENVELYSREPSEKEEVPWDDMEWPRRTIWEVNSRGRFVPRKHWKDEDPYRDRDSKIKPPSSLCRYALTDDKDSVCPQVCCFNKRVLCDEIGFPDPISADQRFDLSYLHQEPWRPVLPPHPPPGSSRISTRGRLRPCCIRAGRLRYMKQKLLAARGLARVSRGRSFIARLSRGPSLTRGPSRAHRFRSRAK